MTSEAKDIDEVRAFWESNPLGSLESPHPVGTREFYDWHHTVRHEDEGLFTGHLYNFEAQRGKAVLDIGCGNGWLVWNFCRNGANVTGVDLTLTAVELTKKRLALYGLGATVLQANAEALPFADGSFDYVTSAGVLHHTPDTEKAVAEALRVMRRGGRGMFAFYYRHPFLSRLLWPASSFFLRLLLPDVPGKDRPFGKAQSAEELVRFYDGQANPIGKMYSRAQMRRMFASVTIERLEIHYFPTRFFVRGVRLPFWVRKFLDAFFGLMVYVAVQKD